MPFINRIQTLDTHTGGEPTRVVIGGFPELPGKTVMEKKQYFVQHYDYLRRAVMLEPRGHADMFGAIITEACDPECAYGMIFMDAHGCLNMCGHGTIGVVTALMHLGMVEQTEPYTCFKLEAPAGPVEVRVRVENGRAMEVAFHNVASFTYLADVAVEVPQLGTVHLDIAFGGNFFGIVDKDQLQIADITPEQLPDMIPKAISLKHVLNEQLKIQHPALPIDCVDLIEIFGPPKVDGADVQNVVIFGEGEVDRSPCGTGTSAKLAVLASQGQLQQGEEFVHESIFGTVFRARIADYTKVGGFDAIIPEIIGAGYVTGRNEWLIDEDDPFKYGFMLTEHK